MNERHDARRHERICEQVPREPRVSQRPRSTGQPAGERAPVALIIVDTDAELVVGGTQREVEREVDVGKGRDVEVLGHSQPEGAVSE